MYHPRLKGKHYDMGCRMGEIFTRANARFPLNLDTFQSEYGRRSVAILRDIFPEAAEEISGITDTIGIDYVRFASWMMCMGCCMYNLSESDSAEIRGCTAFSFTHNGGVFYARDNDLPPFLGRMSKAFLYAPEGGNRFILNTSSFINGEEGINHHGLVAAMTFVRPRLDEIRPGLNSVFLVRYLLEKCATVDDGITALEKIPASSICNILLADASGRMAVVETCPSGTHVRLPETNPGGDRFIVTVNHVTSDKMKKHDAGNGDVFLSKTRYQTAHNALMSGIKGNAVTYAESVLRGDHGFMCQYDKSLDFETVWASVFDISEGRILRAEGNPAKKRFVEDTRLDMSRKAARAGSRSRSR